ncbi:hypothetical protein ACFQS3_09895 [Glycomyces mayteni]|uniref:Uncharacterized protein n=1 Tax=Glycomyces mayteni TaxID=543887 RepID=A0ABW2D5C1_9ACTN|nr:hypothetical protein GCM10025732_29630 [Glycomyces mayteni]
MNIEDEYRRYGAYWTLMWGVRLLLFSPLVFAMLVVLNVFVSMPGDVFAGALFVYTVGALACFVPGLSGLFAFLDVSVPDKQKRDDLAAVRGDIWLSMVRQAVFLRRK